MILILWASPNAGGLTNSAADQVAKGIAEAGESTSLVHLNSCRLDRCKVCGNGWGLCRAEGRCVITDDFQDLYDQVEACRGVAIVTPVYWHDLAEPLKAFLDRLRRCETAHNHRLRRKPCLLVACAGGTGRGAVQCLRNLEETLDHMDMVPVDRLPVIQFNKDYMLPALKQAGSSFAEYLARLEPSEE